MKDLKPIYFLFILAVNIVGICKPIWANSCNQYLANGNLSIFNDSHPDVFRHQGRNLRSGPDPTLSVTPVVGSFTPGPYVYQTDVLIAGGNRPVFVIAGVNSNEAIANIGSLTGVTLEVLTDRALPNAEEYAGEWGRSDNDTELFQGLDLVFHRRSGVGQIGRNETMREVLMRDNALVLGQNLTHQRVAEPLLSMITDFESELQKATSTRIKPNSDLGVDMSFNLKGREYKVSSNSMGRFFFLQQGNDVHSGWIGSAVQGSIFNDLIFADWYFTITDVSTGKTLKGDALTPHLIYRYGFYQSGPYRMDPQAIIDFFDLAE